METCQNRNFYFELPYEVSIFLILFFECDGPIKMAHVDQKKRKVKLGSHPNLVNKNLTMSPNFCPCH